MTEIPPAIRTELDALHAADERHDADIARLTADMVEIRESLKCTATKDDIQALRSHISDAVNGILRDALNATPMRQSVFWSAIVAVATIGLYIMAIKHP